MSRILARAALAIAAVLAVVSCGRKAGTPDTRYAGYVKAYTGGIVWEGATVKVSLAAPASEFPQGLFSFSPAVKGTQRWVNSSLVEFVPEQGALQPGRRYSCTFRLGDAVKVPKGLEKFSFGFIVAEKQAVLSAERVRIPSDNPSTAIVEGSVKTSERASLSDIQAMMPENAVLEEGADGKLFRFSIPGFTRSASDRKQELSMKNGAFKAGGKATVTIPGTGGAFRVTGTSLVEDGSPYIEAVFSEPVATDGAWYSLFRVSNVSRSVADARDNVVRIYYEGAGGGDISLDISGGLRSAGGERLGDDFSSSFERESAKPAVQIPLEGNILPDESCLVLPFRAVNLKAVDVRVVKIYEDNVLMFLQDNALGDGGDLRRAGRLVWQKRVSLADDPSKDLRKWNDFALDLKDVFRKEPGAIYRIRISFKEEYSLYGKEYSPGEELSSVEVPVTDSEVWDIPSPYYWDSRDWSHYNWKDSDDPATPSYYIDYPYPEVNLMTSSLGVTAKYAGGDRLWVAASDLLSAEPSQAEVEVYNYQLREVGRGRVSGSGEIALTGKPFAVVARHGSSTTYLKVTDGRENSLSRFDVGGAVLQKGLKASIYGERGVWRPGDTLHLTMILQGDKIPSEHPASLEVYTPEGQFHSKINRPSGVNGFYRFDVPTMQDDPTGIWSASFKLGGATFHKALRIESIKPNRLKVEIDMGGDEIHGGSRTPVSVASSWLTGPAAAGLRAKAYMVLGKANTTFKGYEGYIFNNPLSEFSSSEKDILDTRLDGSGRASLAVDMPGASDAPGKLNATVVCSVLEEGGDASFTTVSMPFSPFRSYVGVKVPEEEEGYMFTGRDNQVQVVLLSEDGAPVEGHELEYRVYKIDWSWWWENGRRALDSYVNSSSARVFTSGRLRPEGGASSFVLNVPEKEWGRYLIYVRDLDGGHASGTVALVDWPSYRGRTDHTDPTSVNMLSFSLDRKSYAVGDKAVAYIPAAPGGRALVSIENASGVISQKWVRTSDQDTPYSFSVTAEMAPNFYVDISLVQPHENAVDGVPIRLYGVQPALVENPRSHLSPVIGVADAVHPGESFSIKVSEKNGRPMTYTLAIVDEGLLDLTGFKTPDPWNDMYRREALGVRTWDVYDDVIGRYGAAFSSMLGIGGDESMQVLGAKKDNRFTPVVEFLGPFTMKRGGDTHKITLPMYVGSVRVMLVAGQDGAYGSAHKTVAVRSPLMVVPTLPRVISTGEKVTLPVNVFALEDGIRSASVKVETDGPVKISGPASASATFDGQGDRLVRFALETTGEGTAHVKVTASGNGHDASETINIEVRNPNPAITSVQTAAVAPGASLTMSYRPSLAASLGLSSFPAVNFDENYLYFRNYGYACTEQLAAEGISLVFTRDFLDGENRAGADSRIPSVLRELYARQLADGGFAYWPGNTAADTWATSMAGVFMNEAASKGFDVNKSVLDKWQKFQNNSCNNYRRATGGPMSDLDQAYRLYSLALAGKADAAGMNRLKESGTLTSQARWMLACAYSVCGKKEVAVQLTDTTARSFAPYSDGLTFGSPWRDRAVVTEALVLQDDIAAALEPAGAFGAMFAGGHVSTQVRAFASVALSRLAAKVNSGPLKAEITQNGSTENVNSPKASYTYALEPSAGSVQIKNESGGTVYATVMAVTRASGQEATPARSNGLSIKAEYSGTDGTPLDPASIRQGTDFISTVTVTNLSPTEDRRSLALTQMLPSGWEIYNERLTGAADGSGSAYNDLRDDRSLWFFDLPAGTSRSFRLRLRAAYEGEFVLPAVKCEAMYDTATSANTASGKTAVTR